MNGDETTDDRSPLSPDLPLDRLYASDVPYQPVPGGPSILKGITLFMGGWQTREQKLARPIRAGTLNWLTVALAQASRRTLDEARMRLLEAIPAGFEDVLDGGEDFILAVDQAAVMLGCDPSAVVFRLPSLNS